MEGAEFGMILLGMSSMIFFSMCDVINASLSLWERGYMGFNIMSPGNGQTVAMYCILLCIHEDSKVLCPYNWNLWLYSWLRWLFRTEDRTCPACDTLREMIPFCYIIESLLKRTFSYCDFISKQWKKQSNWELTSLLFTFRTSCSLNTTTIKEYFVYMYMKWILNPMHMKEDVVFLCFYKTSSLLDFQYVSVIQFFCKWCMLNWQENFVIFTKYVAKVKNNWWKELTS